MRIAGIAAGFVLARDAVAAPADADLVPVRTIVSVESDYAPDLALTGAIAAQVQSNIAFRVNGKVVARYVEVGQHVTADETLATLDPVEQQADLNNAQAALTSAQAQLQQANLTFGRQQTLLASGFTTRATYDQAREALDTTRAQVTAAEAALKTAREQLSYTDLKAGQNGIIVARNVEAGQVVQAGQTVFVLAQDGPRDAVFEIPEVLLTTPPDNKTIDVELQSDPSVKTQGTVREISPTLDATTSTVTVKIGLNSTPPQMSLGAAVVGRAHWRQQKAFVLPWSSLFEAKGQPSVWVVADDGTVAMQPVDVRSYATGSIVISRGLKAGQRVVVAGGQLLFPGQKVAVVSDAKQ